MVYIPPERTAKLVFDDYPGAEVTVRLNSSVGEVLDLLTLGDDLEARLRAFVPFGDQVLVSWNIGGRDGKALPASGAGMLAIPDARLANAILRGWMEAAQGVDGPLPESSDATGT